MLFECLKITRLGAGPNALFLGWAQGRPVLAAIGAEVCCHSSSTVFDRLVIDREVQRTETFTGIEGINTQDQAIQESMGPILDRTHENLAASDMAIVIARRMLLEAAGSVADGGDPPGVGDSYYDVRAIDAIVPNDSDWKEELEDRMYGH